MAGNDKKIQELLDHRASTPDALAQLTCEERAELLVYQELGERVSRRRVPEMPPGLAARVAEAACQAACRRQRTATMWWRYCRKSAIAAVVLLCLTWFIESRPDADRQSSPVQGQQTTLADASRDEQLHGAIYDVTCQLWNHWPSLLTRSVSREREWSWQSWWPQSQPKEHSPTLDSLKEYFHETFRHMGNLLPDYTGFASSEQS